jgi:beta-1,4-mannosyl-glycoprotein beta-1,4-N-acetylglucosaminyltransferase
MIVTAFPFFNELDLLEIRCHELAALNAVHVLVESPTTWSGKPKPLYFQENRARFAQFNIVGAVVELPADVPSPWDREFVAHHALFHAVREVNPRIAIWTDADEIPKASTVANFEAMNVPAAHVDMDFVAFTFDRVDLSKRDIPGGGTTAKIHHFNRFNDWHPWRGEFHHPRIPDSGWHFDYQGGKARLLEKLAAFSHGDEPGGRSMRAGVEAGHFPGIERTIPYPFESLPLYVQQNRDRFASYFTQT